MASHDRETTPPGCRRHRPRRRFGVILEADLYAARVPGHWELIVLAVVVLLLFGSSRVPEIARQLGRGLREVKGTMRDADVRDEMRRALEAPEDEARTGGTAARTND